MPQDLPDGNPRGEETAPRLARARAFGVHILTACGAALGLLALFAAVRGDWALMFAWLGGALVVDGIDGAIARRVRVADVLPQWSGDTLDGVVDFITYVLVPAYAIAAGGLLPPSLALAMSLVIVVTSALYFADTRMKTDDYYFRGFPALWNAVAFYLFLVRPAPWLAAAIVAALVILTFVPIRFVHPFRVARMRIANGLVVGLWAVLVCYVLLTNFDPGWPVTVVLSAIALYFFVPGFLPRAKP